MGYGEQYIELKTAQLLLKAGFPMTAVRTSWRGKELLAAYISQDLARRWLREECHIDIDVCRDIDGYDYDVVEIGEITVSFGCEEPAMLRRGSDHCPKYEAAVEEAICFACEYKIKHTKLYGK